MGSRVPSGPAGQPDRVGYQLRTRYLPQASLFNCPPSGSSKRGRKARSRPLFYFLLELLDHSRTVSLSSISCSKVSPSSRARSSDV